MRATRSTSRTAARAEVDASFGAIRTDRARGAQSLALEALAVIGRLLRRWAGGPHRQLRARFRWVAANLSTAQPAMGAFLRWAEEWRRMARNLPERRLLRSANAWVRRERAQLYGELLGVGRTSRAQFPEAEHVLTLSRSQSVLSALRALGRARRPHRVSVLESRPGGEGREFADDLKRAGLSARVIPDHRGAEEARKADLLLIGADAVFSDGSVAHKVGTRRLARAAASAGVPVVVVAGVSKFTGGPPPRRDLPSLFDRTPARYIREYWTDRGLLAGAIDRTRSTGRGR